MNPSTPAPSPFRRFERLAYGLLGLSSLVYAGATLLIPLDPHANTFDLSTTSLHLLQLTIIVPIIAIWFVALWGSLRFKEYAQGIIKSPDGMALNRVASGLLWVVAGLVISAVIGAFRPLALSHGLVAGWTRFDNYSTVVLALVGFGVLNLGAGRLAGLVGHRGYRARRWVNLLILLAMGVVYVWLLSQNPHRLTTPDPSREASFYLSDWLLMITIVLPYLVVWYWGLMAAAGLRVYHLYSEGIIYRRALARVSTGLLAVIGASLLIQLLSAVAPSLQHLGLGAILLLLYVLILIYASGHVLIASGARKLAQIEEVR